MGMEVNATFHYMHRICRMLAGCGFKAEWDSPLPQISPAPWPESSPLPPVDFSISNFQVNEIEFIPLKNPQHQLFGIFLYLFPIRTIALKIPHTHLKDYFLFLLFNFACNQQAFRYFNPQSSIGLASVC